MTPHSILLTLFYLILLGGCSLSGAVTRSSLDYDQVLEAVTNDMLVTNILLARDQAPLHFTDLSQIRGSLQLQMQAQAAEPFGSEFTSEDHPRAMLTGLIAGASNPSFDVVPLNTKSFTEGISAPIDTRYFQYFFNKEQDSKHLLTIARLLFDKLRLVWKDDRGLHGCSYFNSPDRNATVVADEECAAEARKVFGGSGREGDYFDFVAAALPSDGFYVRKAPTIIGPDIAVSGPDLLRQASTFAAPSLNLQRRASDRRQSARYALSRESEGGVFCLRKPSQLDRLAEESSWLAVNVANLGDPVDISASADPNSVCNGESSSGKASGGSPAIYLYGRSVEVIFQYLGRMLTYHPSERAIPFYIDSQPLHDARFSVDYRGKTYYVSESLASCDVQDPSRGGLVRRDCRRASNGVPGRERGDETLFVLSILNQLLDLYKSGSDIPVTPAVQSVR